MKPTKNRIFCPACLECKMGFETEKEAIANKLGKQIVAKNAGRGMVDTFF